jgi:hypothetical protein
VLILIIVLVATNLLTLGALAWYVLRPVEHPAAPEAAVARALADRRPGASSTSVRRVITIEILNPIELAGSRGRWAGIAGSLAPGLTNRVVYDQAMRLVRQQLASHNVVADVRLHIIGPEGGPPISR